MGCRRWKKRQKGKRKPRGRVEFGRLVCEYALASRPKFYQGRLDYPAQTSPGGPKIGESGHVALSTSQKVQFMYRARVEADRTLPRVGGEVDGARGVANGRSDRTEKGADGDTYSLGNWHSIVAL